MGANVSEAHFTRLLQVLSLFCEFGLAEDLFDRCVSVLGELLAQSAKRLLEYTLAALSLVEGLCSVDTKWEMLFRVRAKTGSVLR